MTKHILCFLPMLIAACSAFSQDCTEATLMQKPGDWQEGLKGATSGVSAADLAREKSLVTTLHTMIRSTYKPMGVRAVFHGGYNRADPAISVNTYTYDVIPLNYFCEAGAVKTAHETSTYFQIGVNFFDAEIYYEAGEDRASSEGFHVMTDMPIEKDGYYFFKEKDVGLGFGVAGKSNMWLITYNGKLPYSYVSKKEFLEKRKKNLANEMQVTASGFNDVIKNIEIEKTYKELEYKNDPEKLKRYIQMDYQPGKERYEKLLADNEKNFQPAFAKVDGLLKMPAAELSQPAIVKIDPHDHLSYLFTDDDDPFGKVLIKPNPAYFNRNLPRSSAQFFSVYIIGNPKDPVASKVMTDIIKAVDFTALKSMLGK
jgi:hypothetical protein